ncbi:MAG: DUF501 domain-containing protein [Gaiellales bacterium]
MTTLDEGVLERQLGRQPRALSGVCVRCPHGRPAVISQRSYLDSGEPFPTTYYLTCPAAARRVSELESAGGVARFEELVAHDPEMRASYLEAQSLQRRLRRHGPVMADGGSSLHLGIGGTARDGAVKCLHAHAAFALAHPGYALGERIIAEAAPLFPAECCTP